MKQTLHSKEFKEQALRKLRERGNLTQQSIADELNIPLSTLNGWLQASTALVKGLPHGATPLPADVMIKSLKINLQPCRKLHAKIPAKAAKADKARSQKHGRDK